VLSAIGGAMSLYYAGVYGPGGVSGGRGPAGHAGASGAFSWGILGSHPAIGRICAGRFVEGILVAVHGNAARPRAECAGQHARESNRRAVTEETGRNEVAMMVTSVRRSLFSRLSIAEESYCHSGHGLPAGEPLTWPCGCRYRLHG
jgi:hypothetical protein